jgi:uncharacterized protein YukE
MHLKPKIQDFSVLLLDINRQLNEIANIMRETDQQIASSVRSGF